MNRNRRAEPRHGIAHRDHPRIITRHKDKTPPFGKPASHGQHADPVRHAPHHPMRLGM